MNKNLFKKVEDIFIIFCAFWGILFLFINPPFCASDETSHFYKMYGFTQGTFFYQKYKDVKDGGKEYAGLKIPRSILKVSRANSYIWFNTDKKTSLSNTFHLSKVKLEPQNKHFFSFCIPSYTPISYFPACIVLFVLKIFKVAPVIMMYAVRYVILLTYLSMIYLAIKITPVKKWLFFLCATTPTAIYLAGAVNTDAIVTGYAFLLTAYVFYLAYSDKITKITSKQLWIFSLLSILLAVCKFPYCLMIFLLSIVPKEKFENPKLKWTVILGLLSILTLYTFFTIILNKFMTKGLLTVDEILTARFAKHSQDAFMMLHSPLKLWHTLYGTFIFCGASYLSDSIAKFGWTDTSVPTYVSSAYLLILLLCGFFKDKDEPKINLSIWSRLLFILIFLLVTAITLFASLSIFGTSTWNGYDIILNFQGRYWIPMLPIIFICFSYNKFNINYKWFKLITIATSSFLFFVCLVKILYRFYV